MAINVRCRNRNCAMFNQVCEFPSALAMAPGELIVCGGCGHEPVWVGAERPLRTLPFDETRMNKTEPFLAMDDADA